MVGRGSLAAVLLLAFAASAQACWYPYDATDCYIAYQGNKTECQASYDFLAKFVKGVDALFAPASSSVNDPNSICLLWSPFSCTATYKSYLANGGRGVNATYPACPANIQTALKAWIEAGAFSSGSGTPTSPPPPRSTTSSTTASTTSSTPSPPSRSTPTTSGTSCSGSSTVTTCSRSGGSSITSVQTSGGTAFISGGRVTIPFQAANWGR